MSVINSPIASCIVSWSFLSRRGTRTMGRTHPLGKTLLGFALLYSVLEGQLCLLLQMLLDFLLLHSSPL